jgi:hypothetical protein
MVECRIAKSCPFYTDQRGSQPANVRDWLRVHYCRGNFSMCARHTIHEAIGQEYIPTDLFPNELIRAHQILSQANRYRGGVRKVE